MLHGGAQMTADSRRKIASCEIFERNNCRLARRGTTMQSIFSLRLDFFRSRPSIPPRLCLSLLHHILFHIFHPSSHFHPDRVSKSLFIADKSLIRRFVSHVSKKRGGIEHGERWSSLEGTGRMVRVFVSEKFHSRARIVGEIFGPRDWSVDETVPSHKGGSWRERGHWQDHSFETDAHWQRSRLVKCTPAKSVHTRNSLPLRLSTAPPRALLARERAVALNRACLLPVQPLPRMYRVTPEWCNANFYYF